MRKICCFFIFFLFVGCSLSFAKTISVTKNKSGGYVEVTGDILTVEIPDNIPEKTLNLVLAEPNVVKVANVACLIKIVEVIKVIETCTYDEFKFDLRARQVTYVGPDTYISGPKYGFVYSCLLLTVLLYLYPTIFYWRSIQTIKEGKGVISYDISINIVYLLIFFVLLLTQFGIRIFSASEFEHYVQFVIITYYISVAVYIYTYKIEHIYKYYLLFILHVLLYIMIALAIYNM